MSQNLYVTGYGNVTDRHPRIICQQEHTAHKPRLYNLEARIQFSTHLRTSEDSRYWNVKTNVIFIA